MRWEPSLTKPWMFGKVENGSSISSSVVAYRMKEGTPDVWRVVWLYHSPRRRKEERLPAADYTEEELREAIVLKYKLLRGERHG